MEGYPKLLDLMSKRKWYIERGKEEEEINEKNLELSLAPPGVDKSTKIKNSMFDDKSQASFAHFSEMTYMSPSSKINPNSPQFHAPSWSSNASLIQLPQGNLGVTQKESSQPSCTKVVPEEKKTFSATNTAVPNTAQKRTAPGPVVGWPPVRSFRKNLASSSCLKPSSELPNVVSNKATVTGEKPVENNPKGLFVKINMDGIPIGRKVDLKAHDSYEKLSSAVDELFKGLLAAQGYSPGDGVSKKNEGKAISGLLIGNGEYTLVYEDIEGDRMLVGDVPWHMFVSTVKRLRVLKTSQLPMLHRGARQGKLTIES